jgi:hypothetical protein
VQTLAGTLPGPHSSAESAPQFRQRANKYTQSLLVYRFHWKNRFCMRRVEKELAAAASAVEQHTKLSQPALSAGSRKVL